MLTDAQVQRLQDIAYCASHTGNVLKARTIYAGILAIKPQSVASKIGMAFTHLVVDEFDKAEAILKDDVLAATPDDSEARVLLGMNYMLAGRNDEAKTIFMLLQKQNGPASTLAMELLGTIQ